MTYIALLRGINVGKGKRVEMNTLKTLFESLGFTNVSTYINSGNILFTGTGDTKIIRSQLELSFKQQFGLDILTLVKTDEEMQRIAKSIPDSWKNDKEQKSDVAYLFPEFDFPEVINDLPIKKDLVDIRYVPGAILLNVIRENYNKSQLNKLIGHKIYKYMTVRNVNTARHLAGR